ncbi:hypothetical protein [Polyangium sorediatum]|uniref:DUF4276 family protein n=1 Tax=Polyangium sorediatum TaxID=889274 RepID=A0ABT6P071_9BACT|nr:hypothetical protein [Polyangium sorediatum]MDI1434001.1 hypothetical protein [Polyangium sorediatum]
MNASPHLLGLVVEGPSDARTVPEIVDRVLVHGLPAQAEDLDGLRAFRGLDAGTPFLAWRDVDRASRQRRVPPRHGRFGGESAIEDARTAVLALRCFVAEDPQPAAVLLVRDSDGKPAERMRGLEQARKDGDWPFEVVLGVAHTMRECWVIAAFKAQNKEEQQALAKLRKELGFDPTLRSAELDATNDTAKKSPKRVLSCLTDDAEREASGFQDTDIEHLRKVGARNGLAAFLDELGQRLVPRVAARS